MSNAGRIRTIKPEFFTSPDTAKASYRARLLFIAMWCWADDWGIGETNVNGVLGFAFPEADEMTKSDLLNLWNEIADAYGVWFYTVENRNFYQIPTWEQHQRTQRKSSKKRPTADHPDSTPDLRILGPEDVSRQSQGISVRTQGKNSSGTGEQGNRGTGEVEQGNSARPALPLPDDWKPTKTHRDKALALGLDVNLVADEMRRWAFAKDVRRASWNATFNSFLARAKPGVGSRPRSPADIDWSKV